MGAEQSTPRKPSSSSQMNEKGSAYGSHTQETEQRLMTSLKNLDLNAHGSAGLTKNTLDKYQEAFWRDQKNALAMNAILANDPGDVLVNPAVANKDTHVFNVRLDLEGTVTNQKQSGRCWLFAGKVEK
jgi:bleomycin hydrolase